MWEPVDTFLTYGLAYDAATSYCLEEGYKQGAPVVYIDVQRHFALPRSSLHPLWRRRQA